MLTRHLKVKAVLFDLDGTLLDTTEFIFQAYEHTLSLHGIKNVARKELTGHIGKGLKVIYSKIAPTFDTPTLMEAHDKFQSRNFHLVKSFPNVLEVINKLKKKYNLGIVTSRRHSTRTTLKTGGLDPKIFDVIVTADDIENLKPHPEGVILALRELKVKPEEAILIGDATVDIEMGKNAGVKTVGVTYGFGGKDIAKAKPDYLIDDIGELPGILG